MVNTFADTALREHTDCIIFCEWPSDQKYSLYIPTDDLKLAKHVNEANIYHGFYKYPKVEMFRFMFFRKNNNDQPATFKIGNKYLYAFAIGNFAINCREHTQ